MRWVEDVMPLRECYICATGSLHGVLEDLLPRVHEALWDGLHQHTWPVHRVLCALRQLRAAVEPALERLRTESKVRPHRCDTKSAHGRSLIPTSV